MKITKEIAEIAGAFAADGCMQKQHLCMWGNIIEDQEYYNEVLGPLYEQTFRIKLNIHEKRSNSVYGFNVCDPAVLTFFQEKLGFAPGCKTYTVQAPQPVLESDNPHVWAAFLRGYTDCDGSLSFMKRPETYGFPRGYMHMYPRISICSVSEQMVLDISELLTRLNIRHTVHGRQPKNPRLHYTWRIIIRGEKRLKQWMKVIGFSNSAKTTKYEVFCIHGYVPPYTSIVERRQFIKRERCPLEYYLAL